LANKKTKKTVLMEQQQSFYVYFIVYSNHQSSDIQGSLVQASSGQSEQHNIKNKTMLMMQQQIFILLK
jgi:hypothetical protein